MANLKELEGLFKTTTHAAGPLEIIVENSFCYLENFPNKLLDEIKSLLTYENKEVGFELHRIEALMNSYRAERSERFRRMLWSKKKQLEKEHIVCLIKDNRIYTGNLSIVENFLNKKHIKFTIIDNRKKPEKFHIFRWEEVPPPLRYYQKEALEIAFQKENGVLSLCTGTGKTLLAVYLIHRFAASSLIVVPSSAILTQFYDILVKYFGKAKVRLLNTKNSSTKTKYPIQIATYQTLASLKKKKLLQQAISDVGFLLMDEAHHSSAKSIMDLLEDFNHIYYRFAASATYTRNDSSMLSLLGFMSSIIYDYPYNKAVEDKFLVPLNFVFLKVPGRRPSNFIDEPGPLFIKELSTNTSNKDFFKLVGDICIKCNNKQVLILVNRKEALGEQLYSYLMNNNINVAYLSGDNKKEEVQDTINKFNNKELSILIGTSILGEGVDIRSADCLINCQFTKSEIQIMQALGRVARLYPNKQSATVYDFNFVGTKYLSKHANIRLNLYKSKFPGSIILERESKDVNNL